ncbi:hypothetical protein D3C80_1231610 [compost metagenome]
MSTPPPATTTKLSEACASEKEPVSTAATAKLKQTRPVASLSSDSPSRMCISREGSGESAVIAPTATGSVGDRIAARAKATASGTAGSSQWMK